MPWINGVSNLFSSNQESETYAWLGMAPAMRGVGRRTPGQRIDRKQPGHSQQTLRGHAGNSGERRAPRQNRPDYGAGNDFADRAMAHWGGLLSTLIIAGESTACYDGQYYFDTDHLEGDSYPKQRPLYRHQRAAASVHGVITAPSVEE